MSFPIPNWINEIPPGLEKERALDRFIIQLACVYASKRGSIRSLADLLGANYQTLKSQVSDCKSHRIPPETFDDIYELLGPKFKRMADRDRFGA